jgi:hypothetical protein
MAKLPSELHRDQPVVVGSAAMLCSSSNSQSVASHAARTRKRRRPPLVRGRGVPVVLWQSASGVRRLRDHPVADEANALAFCYFICMGEGTPGQGSTAQVVSTRMAPTGRNRARFVLEFMGPTLGEERLREPLHVAVRAEGGRIVEQHIERNRRGGGCRAAFEVVRDADADVDLRAFLHGGPGDVLTETWSYLWQQNL